MQRSQPLNVTEYMSPVLFYVLQLKRNSSENIVLVQRANLFSRYCTGIVYTVMILVHYVAVHKNFTCNNI